MAADNLLDINKSNVSHNNSWLSLLALFFVVSQCSHYHGVSAAFWISRIYGLQGREASPVLISHMQAPLTILSPSEHHQAASHSRDDFWWDASQRRPVGSAKKSCTETDARNRLKQKQYSKFNISSSNGQDARCLNEIKAYIGQYN